MPIVDEDGWNECIKNNEDPYGKCCVDVARRVMELLEDAPEGFSADELVNQANREVADSGITGFMAGAAASMVSHVHSRGDEFRRSWNKETQIGDEGDEANESGGILNPAVMRVG